MNDMGESYRCELYPTIITPFGEDGGIDYDGLRRLIQHFVRMGCDGIFAVCQSSEMFYLTEQEKLELAAFSIGCCREVGIRCVVSGHTQDTPEAQIVYLRALEALKPDAIILVSNRLAAEDESDAVLVERLRMVCGALPPDVRLGMYECPYPYKRVLSETVIDAMIADGRFDFLKDTSCEIDIIRGRLVQMKGSNLGLYNANTATLYESILAGAAGYSGIQLNFVPELFRQLKEHITAVPPHKPVAAAIADYLCANSIIECQNYPANAKYYLSEKGILSGTHMRNGAAPLTETRKMEIASIMRQNEQAWYRFARRTGHEPIFRRGEQFISCHASTVLPLADGTVLCAYFAGDYEKADNVGIWLSRRVDGIWQRPVRIAKVNDTAHWNPVLMHTSGGVRIVFKVGRTIPAWKSYTMTSADGGATWSAPVAYGAPNDAGGPVRSKPIVLSNGRMLAPNSDETATDWTVRVDVSEDEGAHFARLADIPINTKDPGAPNYIEGKGAIQPTLWESTPGHVHALLRTTCGYIFRSDSQDYGATWCEAYSTGMPNNNSGIDVATAGDTLYLVMNPVSANWGLRTPLVVLRSTDNGAHFSHFTTLEDTMMDMDGERMAEFSYPAIVHAGSRLHITYTYMRKYMAYAAVDV